MSRKNSIKDIDKKFSKELGNRLKIFAQTNFKSVTALAKAIGVPQSQLQKYISGDNVPGGNILFKLTQVGLSLDFLFFGNEETGNESVRKILNKYEITDIKKLDEVLKMFNEIKTKLSNFK